MTSSRPRAAAAPAAIAAIAALAAVVVAFAAVAVTAAPASAASGAPAWVRLAHLSPDTPAVDIYLSSFRGTTPPVVLPNVEYGTLSDYRRLPEGYYTVAMREPGADPANPPILSSSLRVGAKSSYTVAALGLGAELGLRVLDDDLGAPRGPNARVRVIQAAASADDVDIVAVGGPVIARDLGFDKVTGYRSVPAGPWTIETRSDAAPPVAARMTLDLAPRAVYTVLVLDGPSGGAWLRAHLDAGSAAMAPRGGIATGQGGAAGPPGRGAGRTALAVVGVAVIVLVRGLIARARPGRRR
jgi:hypothetical protein